jgi:hypothetical protein
MGQIADVDLAFHCKEWSGRSRVDGFAIILREYACMRLYAYLGQQLAAQTKPVSPFRERVMTLQPAVRGPSPTCRGPLSRCPPRPFGDEHRAHDSQRGEFSGHYATSFLALDNGLRQSLPVRKERHGQIMRGQQRLHRAARDRSREQKTLRPVASMVHQGPCRSRGFDPLGN